VGWAACWWAGAVAVREYVSSHHHQPRSRLPAGELLARGPPGVLVLPFLFLGRFLSFTRSLCMGFFWFPVLFFLKKGLGLSEWSISDMNRYFFWATKSDFVPYFFDLTSPSIDPSVG
jgi:hypothetical protein